MDLKSSSSVIALLYLLLLSLIFANATAKEQKCSGVAPRDGFTCTNRVWMYNGDLNITGPGSTLNLETLGDPVLILGSLTVNRIVFAGQPTFLNVSGCISLGNDGSGYITFKPSKAERPSVPANVNVSVITTYGTNCRFNISRAFVNLTNPMGCSLVNVVSVPQPRVSHLVVRFSIHNGACRKLGIIVGSLIGGLLLLTATIIGISFFCCKKKETNYERINYS